MANMTTTAISILATFRLVCSWLMRFLLTLDHLPALVLSDMLRGDDLRLCPPPPEAVFTRLLPLLPPLACFC